MAYGQLFSRILTKDGDRATIDAAINHATASYWEVRPFPGETLVVTRMMGLLADVGSFDVGKFGNGVVLANGLSISVVEGTGGGATTLYDLTDPIFPIKANEDWAIHCYDDDVKEWGTGPEFLHFRWTWERHGALIILRESQALRVTIGPDNLSGLVGVYFMAQGNIPLRPQADRPFAG